MIKFAIFEKSNQFYWSNNKVIYPIIALCLIVGYLKTEILKIERNLFDNILISIFCLTWVIGIILKIIGLTKVKPLRGKLNGFIHFEVDSISIKEDIILLNQIKNINILNNDYLGAYEYSRGNLNPSLSNGTENFLNLTLYTGENKKFQYELLRADDFQKIRKTLIHYYLLGKITFSNLAEVLGERSHKEIELFKAEIESTATNSAVKQELDFGK